ncbi:MAG: ArsR family transcriptional regulator [Candidatus Lokiarchaeota archaeon]|nr:ArsR family transcriptional regulator [Candidatus Lokiarchaeota archaeon]
MKSINRINFPETQIKILELLFEDEYLQGDLKEKLATTGSNLHYHLSNLEKNNLIIKETVYQIGNAKQNKIRINPTARQIVRKTLGHKLENFTLITGYGSLGEGYKLPQVSYNLLKQINYPINRIICFTSQDAIEKRKEKIKNDVLSEIKVNLNYKYEDYRHIDSNFFNEIENIINNEIKNSDIIIDLTPLSKLYSFTLLKLANKFKLPCFYIGLDKNEDYELINMTNMKIYGEFKEFD